MAAQHQAGRQEGQAHEYDQLAEEVRDAVTRAVGQQWTDFEGPDDFLTPAHQQAWQTFREDPVTQEAQQVYTAREHQLQPLRDAVMALREAERKLTAQYNDERTTAHLEFQAAAHRPMLVLTNTLRQLDPDHPVTSE